MADGQAVDEDARRLTTLIRHFLPTRWSCHEAAVWQLDSELAQKAGNTSGTYLQRYPPSPLFSLSRSVFAFFLHLGVYTTSRSTGASRSHFVTNITHEYNDGGLYTEGKKCWIQVEL